MFNGQIITESNSSKPILNQLETGNNACGLGELSRMSSRWAPKKPSILQWAELLLMGPRAYIVWESPKKPGPSISTREVKSFSPLDIRENNNNNKPIALASSPKNFSFSFSFSIREKKKWGKWKAEQLEARGSSTGHRTPRSPAASTVDDRAGSDPRVRLTEERRREREVLSHSDKNASHLWQPVILNYFFIP